MEQRVTLVTLGVSDYARAKEFYAALGWRPALEVEETAFFQGNGIILALWGREKLAPDLGIADDGARWSGIALAHNVRSREEVHAVIEQARKNGAQITREPRDTFYGGYAGAFRGSRWARLGDRAQPRLRLGRRRQDRPSCRLAICCANSASTRAGMTAIVRPTHGAPTDRAALERALA
jgi:uncharacterized protein